MSGAHLLDLQATPAGAVSGKSDGVFRNARQVKCELVGSGRNRTSCPKGLRLQRSDGTSLSLPALPDHSPCGRRDRSRTDLEQLMRLPGSRTALQKNWRKAERTMPIRLRVPIALQAMPAPRRLAFRKWRSGEVSIPTRCRAASFRSSLPSRRLPLQVAKVAFPRRVELRTFRFGGGCSFQ